MSVIYYYHLALPPNSKSLNLSLPLPPSFTLCLSVSLCFCLSLFIKHVFSLMWLSIWQKQCREETVNFVSVLRATAHYIEESAAPSRSVSLLAALHLQTGSKERRVLLAQLIQSRASGHVSCMFSITVINTMSKRSLGRKGFISSHMLWSMDHMELQEPGGRNQSRECFLLDCSQAHCSASFLMQSRKHVS